MIKLKITMIASLLCASAWAGPILVGGAGESEYSVVFAQSNFQQIIDDCIRVTCALSQDEQASIQTVSRIPMPQIIFKHANEMGADLFRIVDATVWLNQDLLWMDEAKAVPYSVGDGAALWLKILATNKQPSFGDAALQKVAGSQKGITRASGLYEQYEYLLWKRSDGSDELYIRDSVLTNLALTEVIGKALPCDNLVPKVKLFSPAWIDDSRHSDVRSITLGFGLKWSCGIKSGNTSGVAIIGANKDSNILTVFDPSNLFIQIE